MKRRGTPDKGGRHRPRESDTFVHNRGAEHSENRKQAHAYPIPASIVPGRKALADFLRVAPGRIEKVLFDPGRQRNAEFADLLRAAEEKHIPCEAVDAAQLDSIAGSDRHQSVLAVLKPKPRHDLKEFLRQTSGQEKALLVALDDIQDPQNLGSALRAAECFGCDAAFWSRNRGAGLTALVAKVSCGASELLQTIEVANLANGLEEIKRHGWWILGADVGTGSAAIQEFEFPARSVVVLGAEGAGLRRLTRERCDFLVKIPMYGRLDSLNVAQALSVLLYEYRRQHPKL